MELEAVFAETDLLVVPSICPETFGYVVLEALSCGVPVLLSGNVGARDILAQGAGIVIVKHQEIPMMDRVAVRIEEKCYGWDRRGGWVDPDGNGRNVRHRVSGGERKDRESG